MNVYVVAVQLNGQDYASFHRDERKPRRPWTDDVGDHLPVDLGEALDSLESALEHEPSNEASHPHAPLLGGRMSESEDRSIATLALGNSEPSARRRRRLHKVRP